MNNNPTARRRRFLGVAGTGIAAAIAGCTDDETEPADLDELQNDGEDVSDVETPDDVDGAVVSLAVEPDEEELIAAQEDINARREAGEISDQEAQMEMAQTEQELVGEAVEDARNLIESADGAVVDVFSDGGLLLVAAPPESLISVVSDDVVFGIFGPDVFEEAQTQQPQPPEPE